MAVFHGRYQFEGTGRRMPIPAMPMQPSPPIAETSSSRRRSTPSEDAQRTHPLLIPRPRSDQTTRIRYRSGR